MISKKILVTAFSLLFASHNLIAASFTIKNGQTETNTLTLNDNETGLIEDGGEINFYTYGYNVYIDGADVELINNGTINSFFSVGTSIAASGNNASITNNGRINSQHRAIRTWGDNTKVINTGTINAVSFGILSTADNVTIINENTISAGSPIHSEGDNNTIINNGAIDGFRGILSSGHNSSITNNGSIDSDQYTIHVIDDVSYTYGGTGISIVGYNNIDIVTNNGSIDAEDTGIYSYGENIDIINNGQIYADEIGIEIDGDNQTVINNGTIKGYYGISSEGDNHTIINNGEIIGEIYGFLLLGDNLNITNNDTIISGDDGIYPVGENNIIVNNGVVNAADIGVHLRGTSHQFTNNGNIAANEGIYLTGNNHTVDNHGEIIASNNGIEIFPDSLINDIGKNIIINNRGVISAENNAILGTDGDTTVNLLEGSQIQGTIDLGNDGGDNDTVNIYGSASTNLTILNTENINLFTNGVISGNTVSIIDTTAESNKGFELVGMTNSIHSTVSQRMTSSAPLKPVQVASLELSPGMYFTERKPIAWAQVFGQSAERDAKGGAMGFDTNHIGTNIGYEWDVDTTRFGLMGGFAHADTDTQVSSFTSESDSVYLGAYANTKARGLSITGSLITGHTSYDNERIVIDAINGQEIAKSDFDSFFISPSLTIGTAYTYDEFIEIRPQATLNYSIAWLDDYQESGTTASNLLVDERTAKALSARAQIAAAYAFANNSELELRVGVDSRHSDDDEMEVSFSGSKFKFDSVIDDAITTRFFGARLRVADSEKLRMIADIEIGGNADEDYKMGNITLEFIF